jgi:arsenate reductase
MKLYTYANCGTCRNALKFLAAQKIPAQPIPIREQPPSKSELESMSQIYGGDIRKLFNTSGQDYKALNLKDKLPAMSAEQAIDLLSKNGNLVKRPFLLTERGGLVGFKEEEWRKFFA